MKNFFDVRFIYLKNGMIEFLGACPNGFYYTKTKTFYTSDNKKKFKLKKVKKVKYRISDINKWEVVNIKEFLEIVKKYKNYY